MEILHLCNDYSNQKLYLELIRSLSNRGLKQFIYVPVRSNQEVGRYRDETIQNARWQYSKILTKYLKFFYKTKLWIKEKDLNKHIHYPSFALTHAHFLFSDGGLAYNLKRRHGLPYITAVRNTDLNYFFRYGVHLRKWGIDILLNAEKVIFISPTYLQQLLESYIPRKFHNAIEKKSVIIPNGVDPFWLQNQWREIRRLNEPIRLLYVGEFTKNKNLESSIDACERLQKQGLSLSLTLVGEYGGHEKKIIKRVANNPQIRTLPKISSKSELLACYRDHHIFIMPSFYETFGLVYIEALSQNLPIIYSKNQGIDGYFEDGTAGYAVDPHNVNDIASKIRMVVTNYEHFANKNLDLSQFSWDKVGERYLDIYSYVLNE